MNWSRHVAFAIGKVYRALRSIYYLRRSLTIDVRHLLIRSLCLVHLDYCAAVYSLLDVRTSRMAQVFGLILMYLVLLQFLLTDGLLGSLKGIIAGFILH